MSQKRILSLLLVLTLVCSLFVFPASAATIGTASGAMEATDSQVGYWNSLNKESEAKANRSESEVLAALATDSRASSWILTSRYFYYYGQELGYSCGPACVKMALRNITGTAYSESSIRTGCNTTTAGTYLADMVEYINDMQSHNRYLARYQQTKANMQSNLYSGIVTWDAPPIVGVKETTSTGWRYNLAGHFVTVYAVNSDKTAFLISDPWSGYIGDSANRDLNISVNNLYTGYNAVDIGYMY